jgi:hypothetical protein
MCNFLVKYVERGREKKREPRAAQIPYHKEKQPYTMYVLWGEKWLAENGI